MNFWSPIQTLHHLCYLVLQETDLADMFPGKHLQQNNLADWWFADTYKRKKNIIWIINFKPNLSQK